jgi:hypothetical protein
MRVLLATLAAAAVAAAPCDERRLQRDAVLLLAAHVDVELGGVGAGKRDVVGFQYLVISYSAVLPLSGVRPETT